MGKRSNFDRRERDFYPTPREAVLPLLTHLEPESSFIEPCAGAGDLVRHMTDAGHRCIWAFDVEPRDESVKAFDAMDMRLYRWPGDYIITNPPWSRDVLHPMIEHFAAQRPTWLLFDADWIHTRQSSPFMRLLRKIVSVGRVKWIPDSKMTGKDNCAWHLFDASTEGPAIFVGRA
ncbi:SAM-dependent methyltransferase [Haematobacter massiliensis]|uniref:SAM-dependent methyltransferase n=1 Tax=Haematobacter massiliensis TaxID=195105 RepID=UPI000B4A1798|nr:SAM-dependent methyltransferase [Haematobacter massiliensis]OWJ71397.1 SAM-dependent methyltransferase [Haematobacter massiliensis]